MHIHTHIDSIFNVIYMYVYMCVLIDFTHTTYIHLLFPDSIRLFQLESVSAKKKSEQGKETTI